MGIEEPDIDPTAFLEDVEMRVGTVTSAEPLARTFFLRRVAHGGATP